MVSIKKDKLYRTSKNAIFMDMNDKLVKLNLGCGSQVIEGWINVDYSLASRLLKIPFFKYINRKLNLFELKWSKDIMICDLRKEFPWKDNSVDFIYCSHILEHLTKDEGMHFLSECYRVLKKNCTIRIVVPDLVNIVNKYINENIGAENFIKELGVLHDTNRYGFIKRRLASFISFPHKCMYDEKALSKILKEIGFNAESKKPFESDIPYIKSIELEHRAQEAVIVEGKK